MFVSCPRFLITSSKLETQSQEVSSSAKLHTLFPLTRKANNLYNY